VNNNAGIPPIIHDKALRQLADFNSDIYSAEHAPSRLRYRGKPGY
jgi:hypothetical protein